MYTSRFPEYFLQSMAAVILFKSALDASVQLVFIFHRPNLVAAKRIVHFCPPSQKAGRLMMAPSGPENVASTSTSLNGLAYTFLLLMAISTTCHCCTVLLKKKFCAKPYKPISMNNETENNCIAFILNYFAFMFLYNFLSLLFLALLLFSVGYTAIKCVLIDSFNVS